MARNEPVRSDKHDVWLRFQKGRCRGKIEKNDQANRQRFDYKRRRKAQQNSGRRQLIKEGFNWTYSSKGFEFLEVEAFRDMATETSKS